METIDYQCDIRTSNVINFRRSKEGPPRSQVHRPRATTPFFAVLESQSFLPSSDAFLRHPSLSFSSPFLSFLVVSRRAYSTCAHPFAEGTIIKQLLFR